MSWLWAWLTLLGVVVIDLAFAMDGGWSYALAAIGGVLVPFSLLRLKEAK